MKVTLTCPVIGLIYTSKNVQAEHRIPHLHKAVPGWKRAELSLVLYQGWGQLTLHCTLFDIVLKVLWVKGHLLCSMKDKNDTFFVVVVFMMMSKSGPDCRCFMYQTEPSPSWVERGLKPGCTPFFHVNEPLTNITWQCYCFSNCAFYFAL